MKKHNECTGCGACAACCPENALKLKLDARGFVYPENTDGCTECGQCDRVCRVRTSEHKACDYYVVQHADGNRRQKAQSGGLFTALAESVLEDQGIVYGAALVSGFIPEYVRVDSLDTLHILQGSKYVQCLPGNIMHEVLEDLDCGRTVLFSGTSCMINGLLAFLEQKDADCSGLVTCDIVCHGVASTGLWKDHVALQTKRFGTLEGIVFRDNSFGWRTCMETYTTENGKQVSERVWNDLYFTNVMLRDCCFCCEYVEVSRKPADITMGDFFGSMESLETDRFDSGGISFGACHTEKGWKLLKRSSVVYQKVSGETAMSGNLKEPVPLPMMRKRFWKRYRQKGYESCLRHYSVYGGTAFKVKRKVLKLAGKW